MMALASKRPKAFTQSDDEDEEDGKGGEGLNGGLDTMLCKRVVTKDRRYITQITCFEKGQQHTFGAKAVSPATSGRSKGKKRNNGNVPASNGMPAAGTERNALRLPVFGKQQGGGALASLFSLNRQLGRFPREIIDSAYSLLEWDWDVCLPCDSVAMLSSLLDSESNTNHTLHTHQHIIETTLHKQSLPHLAFRLLACFRGFSDTIHTHQSSFSSLSLLLLPIVSLRSIPTFQLDSTLLLRVCKDRKQGGGKMKTH